MKVDSQASVPEKQEERSKSKKPIKSFKKVKGKRGRKPKVSQLNTMDRFWWLLRPQYTVIPTKCLSNDVSEKLNPIIQQFL